jgi:hypothetical protein
MLILLMFGGKAWLLQTTGMRRYFKKIVNLLLLQVDFIMT